MGWTVIYNSPSRDEPIDQGDILAGCPLIRLGTTEPEYSDELPVRHFAETVINVTQTCDLAQRKLTRAVIAILLNAQTLVDDGVLKIGDVKGPIRAGRIYGWYFLPACAKSGLVESIVDLRQLHTVDLELLRALARRGQRLARLQPLYREHLAKHFADTYSRIGLPIPYETL
jgi:hypothetical protein